MPNASFGHGGTGRLRSFFNVKPIFEKIEDLNEPCHEKKILIPITNIKGTGIASSTAQSDH